MVTKSAPGHSKVVQNVFFGALCLAVQAAIFGPSLVQAATVTVGAGQAFVYHATIALGTIAK